MATIMKKICKSCGVIRIIVNSKCTQCGAKYTDGGTVYTNKFCFHFISNSFFLISLESSARFFMSLCFFPTKSFFCCPDYNFVIEWNYGIRRCFWKSISINIFQKIGSQL